MNCPTDYALNRYLRDQGEAEAIQQEIERRAIIIADKIKSLLGFDFGGHNIDLEDVLNESEVLNEKLIECFKSGDYSGLHSDIEEIIYEYAKGIATKLVGRGVQL